MIQRLTNRFICLVLLLLLGSFYCIHLQQQRRESDRIPGKSIRYTDFMMAMANLSFQSHPWHSLTENQTVFREGLKRIRENEIHSAIPLFQNLSSLGENSVLYRHALEILSALYYFRSDWKALYAHELKLISNGAPEGRVIEQDETYLRFAEAFRLAEAKRICFKKPIHQMALNSSKTGTPILSVEIAGRKLNLWLDSGASISVLSSAVARLCRIESILNQSGSIRSASDYQVRFKGAIVPEMKIGNLIIHDLPVVIVNRFDLRIRQASRVKLKIDGIIGWDLIRYLDLVIDRKNRLIIIRKPEIDTQFLATDRNLFWLGYPIISLSSREGLPLHFGLDTGSTSTKLTDNIHHKIDLKSNKRILKVGSAGGFNEISVRVFPDFSLILCGKMIHYPNIYSHPLHFAAFVRMDGVFGNDLLEKGRVRIDFLNGRFEFMPY